MTVTPYHYVLHIYKGAKLDTPLIWEVDGVPVDFTGRLARCQFRLDPDSDVIFSINPTLNSLGEIRFGMGATETAAINTLTELEMYHGHVEIYDPLDEDDVDRYIEVVAVVHPELTRD